MVKQLSRSKDEKSGFVIVRNPMRPSNRNTSHTVPLYLFLFLSLYLSSCSTGVTVRATRLAGIVLDTTMVVDVGSIRGEQAPKFREDLLAALWSETDFTVPIPGAEKGASNESAYLIIEGAYRPRMDESSHEEQVDGKTQRFRIRTYSSLFEYTITDKVSGERVIDGAVEESKTEKEKDESRGFLESVVNAVVEGVVQSIFSVDKYASLRENIIRRFIGEISPHELWVEVRLFKDSDMPELEQGIGSARIGKWKEAIGLFLSAIEKHPGHENLHKAYYNAGVAYEYDHQYSFALEHLEKAFQIKGNDEYLFELHRCRRYQQEYRWREGYLEKLKLIEK